MANSYGPQSIVQEGLVFAADAGNTACWTPGTSTAYNLIGSNSGSLFDNVLDGLGEYNSWYFDQANDEIRFESAGTLSSTMTISFWIKCDTTTHALAITTGTQSSDQMFIKCLIGNIYIYDTSGVAGKFIYKTSVWTQGVWFHLTMGLTNGGALGVQKMYKDGVDLGTLTDAGSNGNYINTSTTNPIYFGEDSAGTTDFKGNITQMMFYNRILTQAEVLQNYNATKNRFQ